MGIKLPVPLAPFQELDVQGESITIDVNAKQIVIPTNNQYLLPSFNQWTLNPNRCNLEETPCGGLKNSIVQDTFPGSLTIEGDGCYLQNLAGTYTGKSIGAGKLSEMSDIVNTGDTGLEIATADGVILRMGDGLPFLLRPPSAIVEEFVITNISNESQTYTLTVNCPDLISSIELYNITNGTKESVTFTKMPNGYLYSKTISPNYSELFQITAIYANLEFRQSFTNDANQNTGLQNMSESWIALIPANGPEISIFRFSDRPKQLEFKQNENGVITEITLYPGNGSIYHNQITHSDISRTSDTGYIPDSLNINFTGSISKFMRSYGMDTRFFSDATLTLWIVPAISDTKILPLSEISDDLLGDEINLRMCPGEYGCASFVVQSDKDISLEIVASDLICGEHIISQDKIDIRAVKCWIQSGYLPYSYAPVGKYLTPELLLHDDFLVLTDYDIDSHNISSMGNKNILKLDTGYIDISNNFKSTSEYTVFTISERNIKDSTKLENVNLIKKRNKQFWITPHILDSVTPGSYFGHIHIKNGNVIFKSINFSIDVLPITLQSPNIEYSLYYSGRITDTGSISYDAKTVEQFSAEIENVKNHGITNPTVYHQNTNSTLEQVLAIRHACGIDNTNLYYRDPGMYIKNFDQAKAANILNIGASYGVQQLYIYGVDETDMNDVTTRQLITTVHNAGVKIFCAQYITEPAQNIADVLDLVVMAFAPSAEMAAIYHNPTGKYNNVPHKIYSYSNPQSPPEYPRTFRLNYGFLLWQNDYDGVMDNVYQHSYGDIWNDGDHTIYRDHCFTYPTANGVIDTIQWEGLREACNDMKYLATLQAAITEAQIRGAVTADIETWLAAIKSTDLSTVDLDDVRGQMIDYILQLQDTENYRAVLMADGDAICFGNGQQLFVRE